MKKYIFFLLFLTFAISGWSQKERKFIRDGNRNYEKATADTARVDTSMYQLAETSYRKALDVKPNDFKSMFNIGNALFKQNKMVEAESQFEEILEIAPTKEDKANTYFNIGNALLAQQKLDESIDAYKDALRNNPSDVQAKYNLEFARKMKEKQQQQQKQQQEKQEPPTEYAKKLKKTAQELVAERRYMEAYALMKEGESVDPTVKNFEDFTNRIHAIIQISDFKQ